MAAPSWRVGVLGPVSIAGSPPLPRLDRYLLALLAARAGHLVTVAEIIEALWPASAPASARNRVQSLVVALRRRLPGGGLVTRPDGYELAASVDAVLFDRLREQADAEPLEAALALWRGPAYQDVPLAAVRPEATRLDESRLDVTEELVDIRLAQGGHPSVLATLQSLVLAHPTRQRLLGQLMLGLHRSGRQAEALAAYRRGAGHLSRAHGLDPAPELRRLHDLILRDHPSVAAMTATHRSQVPAMLPPDVPGFTGRAAELAELDALLTDRNADPRRGPPPGELPTAAVISAVSGTAGIGKTALAVHWAHRVANRFPDGQLYVNLRAFDPSGRVVAPTEAVRGFLDALGLPPERIPADLDGQVGRYRSLLAGKRVLIVLDNARDTDQIRPLLPGTPTAVVVVTSRNQLTGLIALLGAHPVTLDLLSTADARELLARRIGVDRVTADPDATDSIIAACARLPLALAIAAARARQRGFALAAVAAELGDRGRRLDRLDAGDQSSQIRAVFSWSCTTLTPTEASAFRLLGLHPGPDLAIPAVASLTGRPPVEAHRLLTCLTRANLLTEHAPDRYTFHDLLRAYASDLARTHDSERTRHAALTRLLDHYTRTAYAADRLLHPLRDPIEPPLGQIVPGVVPVDLATDQQAMHWLTAEHRNLIAVLRHAEEAGFDTHTYHLAWALGTFLTRRSHRYDLATAWQTALRTAIRLENIRAQAHAHRALSMANLELERYEDAHDHAKHALELAIRAGDRAGQAHTHRNTAYLHWRKGDPRQALHHAQQSLALFRATGDQQGIANELNGVGWYYAEIGDYTRALAYCEQSLVLLEELSDQVGIAYTLDSLGYAHHHLGHHTTAIDFYQRALALHHHLGDRHDQADTLTRLGDTHFETGNHDAARQAWRQALHILTDIDHPDADTVRAKLDRTA